MLEAIITSQNVRRLVKKRPNYVSSVHQPRIAALRYSSSVNARPRRIFDGIDDRYTAVEFTTGDIVIQILRHEYLTFRDGSRTI